MAPTFPQQPGVDSVNAFVDGNDLLVDCQSSGAGHEGYNLAQCYGYVLGVADADTVVRYKVGAPQLCINGVTREQIHDVVVRYLVAHPETRHTVAALLVRLALREAFPCPKDLPN